MADFDAAGLLGFGDQKEQPGADLNAAWYLRNAKIFAKLTQIAQPGDRVLVVFGAGHAFWLRHFAEHTPGLITLQLLPNTTPVPDNTDTAIVRDGYATVSLLTPPAALDDASVLEAFDTLGSSDGIR